MNLGIFTRILLRTLNHELSVKIDDFVVQPLARCQAMNVVATNRVSV